MFIDKLYATDDLDLKQGVRLLTKYYNPESGRWTKLEKCNLVCR